jgi:hypothetical protein
MYSDYIVYVDESGDHGLESIQEPYPVFVLSFCIFSMEKYSRAVVPAFLDLKFKFFGHDQVVFHAHEIRKQHGPFRVLVNPAMRQRFMKELGRTLTNASLALVATVIDKKELLRQFVTPANPYEIAMRFCLEKTYAFLCDQGQGERRTTVVMERRGAVEDKSLELTFQRITQGENCYGPIPFDIVFADKKSNSTGLQIADLASHPIGRYYLDPLQPNRAYDAIASKIFHTANTGKTEWGVKVFP